MVSEALSPTSEHADLAPDFQVIRPLGAGAVGRVLLAREAELKRLVAIKIPHPEIVLDHTALRRFEREALSAANLTHPNIVSVYRVGHFRNGVPYIVMRYAEGRTLDDVLRSEGALSERDARAILLQLASALSEAHRKGIIHRDIRPGNVMWLRESGHTLLMDFGFAAIMESGSTALTKLTRAGQQLGDFEHMSPEQFRSEQVTPATDIYSLGVLGYELLTGAGPYRVASKAMLGEAHLKQTPDKLANVGRDLAQLLEACLAKKPEHRPTAPDIVRRLSGYQQQPSAVAAADSVDAIPALSTFVRELKRRRVFNVGLVYAGAVFALLQVADPLSRALHLPQRAPDAIVGLALAGFPVALVLTWIFEIRGGRLLVTATPTRSRTAQRMQLLLQVTGLVASLLLAGLIGWWVFAH